MGVEAQLWRPFGTVMRGYHVVVVNVAEAWHALLAPELGELLARGERDAFDAAIETSRLTRHDLGQQDPRPLHRCRRCCWTLRAVRARRRLAPTNSHPIRRDALEAAAAS